MDRAIDVNEEQEKEEVMTDDPVTGLNDPLLAQAIRTLPITGMPTLRDAGAGSSGETAVDLMLRLIRTNADLVAHA